MKNIGFILLLLFCHTSVFSQYQINGRVSNERGEKLQYVIITVSSTGQAIRTDINGGFNLYTSFSTDTLTFWYDGYEILKKKITASGFLPVTLKLLPYTGGLKKNYLTCFIKGKSHKVNDWVVSNETYTSLIENPFVATQQLPSVSFSANINQASYSNVRRFLNMDEMVPPDALRIEEMLNYFNFHYSEPEKSDVFRGDSYFTTCPWNKKKP